MAKLRTRRPKLDLLVFEGWATAQQLTEKEVETIRENFRGEDGNLDMGEIAKEMFRQMLVGLKDYEDEDGKPLRLNKTVKENILTHEPEFFQAFMIGAKEGFEKREDLATKNSLSGAGGSSPQKKKKDA